jgi:hypothetical protein
MSTRDLIDAIHAGNAADIQTAFDAEVSSRIAERLDTMRQEVAKSMFNEATKMKSEEDAEEMEEMSSKEKMKRGLYNKEEVEDVDAGLEEAASTGAAKPSHANALHVKPVGGGKYQVHAVGKNFEHGIKAGEHLSDSELDDFREMGGQIRHVK